MMMESPLVVCLTNTVAANFTANALLAVGARPAMVEEPEEAAELAAAGASLLVNVGTVTRDQAEAMRRAIAVARGRGTPWVLDPVAVQTLSFRRELVREFLKEKPTLVRANAEEAEFLRRMMPEALEGVTMLATAAEDAIYGETGDRLQTIRGGVPMLQRVTATGCAQGAICAAFLGRGMMSADAAREASLLMKRAGEIAYARAQRPGTFQIALIDALAELMEAKA